MVEVVKTWTWKINTKFLLINLKRREHWDTRENGTITLKLCIEWIQLTHSIVKWWGLVSNIIELPTFHKWHWTYVQPSKSLPKMTLFHGIRSVTFGCSFLDILKYRKRFQWLDGPFLWTWSNSMALKIIIHSNYN